MNQLAAIILLQDNIDSKVIGKTLENPVTRKSLTF